MQRVALLINRLFGTHPSSCFVFISILLLLSISLQTEHDSPHNSRIGFAVANAQSTTLEHCDSQLNNGALSNAPTLHELSEETRRLQGHHEYDNARDETNSYISARQGAPLKVIKNNLPENQGVRPGEIFHYSFPISGSSSNLLHRASATDDSDTLDDESLPLDSLELDRLSQELRKRQRNRKKQRMVYVTVNTCSQPQYSAPRDQRNPPQLVLYISQNSDIKEPGPNSDSSEIITRRLVEGYASVTLNSTNDVYASVYAPSVKVLDDTMWIFDLAASVDEPYHSFVNSSLNVFMIDSDRNAALLITKNLSSGTPMGVNTSQWLSHGPPLSIFVHEKNNTLIKGLHQSYCGLNHMATFPGYDIDPSSLGIEFGLTRYGGSSLEQQFYIPNLNATSTYYGILSRPHSTKEDTPGGGGGVYLAMTFSTKRLANCAVVYNLTFCSSIAYAVPANPDKFTSLADLRAIYDSTTAAKYQNFNYSLQQIPCNTTATAQYSLNRTCEDCANAYKKWLCAVSIPRCADWVDHPKENKSTSFLQLRNAAQEPIASTPEIKPITNRTLLDWLATNSSRNNATIAGRIQPGPYAEILPCEDLCYEIVRSCPASFGFGCPSAGRGLEMSYGRRNLEINDGVTCSEPGAVFGLSDARRAVSLSLTLLWICVAGAMAVLFV